VWRKDGTSTMDIVINFPSVEDGEIETIIKPGINVSKHAAVRQKNVLLALDHLGKNDLNHNKSGRNCLMSQYQKCLNLFQLLTFG
jgi:hypothetical protein